jgi:exo-beta-1,3-glucanase (GH17 family)
MKHLPILATIIILAFSVGSAFAARPAKNNNSKGQPNKAMQCVAFSPYVGNINPDYGAHPSHELIDTLLDTLVKETRFRCIMTYGVLNGLDYTFAAAEKRKLKVIAIIWLALKLPRLIPRRLSN